MMKILQFMVLAALMLFILPNEGAAQNKQWTYLVYLVGADLESGSNAGTTDIIEMIDAGATDNVNVVVLTGGADKDGWRTPAAFLYSDGNEIQLDFSANGKAMSSKENVTAFVDWAISNYPSDKVGLTFWNHGSDIRGYGNDEVSGANLSVPAIREALQNTQYITGSNKFELLGFDACLMGNLETVSTLQSFTNWYIGSEEQEPGHGWNYTPIIQALNAADASFTGADLGKVIVDGFVQQATVESTTAVTLGVIDPSAITALEASLVTLFDQLVADGKISKLHKARAKAEEYSKSISDPEQSEDMVDIGDLMKKLKEVDPALTTLADDVIAKVSAAVSYSRNDMARPRATGLSMYIPHNALVNQDELYSVLNDHYYNIDFEIKIRDFIYDDYVGQALLDNNPPSGTHDPDFTLFKRGDHATEYRGSAENVSAIRVDDVVDLEQVQVLLIEELEGFPNEYLMLGSTHADTVDLGADGVTTFAYLWDELWLGINGYPAYISDIQDVEIEDEAGNVAFYTKVHIPAVRNLETDDEQFLILTYLFDEDFNYELESIIPEPYEDQNGQLVIPKQRVSLKNGDMVQLLYEGFNEVTDEEFFLVDDDAIINIITGNDDLELEYDQLEVGNYQLAYLLEDHSQNDTLVFDPTIYQVLDTGVESVTNEGHLTVYPNPSSGLVNVLFSDVIIGAYDLIIYDIIGRTVYSDRGLLGDASLRLTLPDGVYSVEVVSPNRRIVDKLVIQK